MVNLCFVNDSVGILILPIWVVRILIVLFRRLGNHLTIRSYDWLLSFEQRYLVIFLNLLEQTFKVLHNSTANLRIEIIVQHFDQSS